MGLRARAWTLRAGGIESGLGGGRCVSPKSPDFRRLWPNGPLVSALAAFYNLGCVLVGQECLRALRFSRQQIEGCRIVQSKRVRRNEEISTSRVRVIGSGGEQIGILSLAEALEKAGGEGLDLVEVAPNSDPPVCRIMDYGKFVFEQNKKAQSARRKQKQIHVKEVKFRPGTEEGDYQVKLRNLIRFLSHGDKTKVTLRFRGREMAHQELGIELLKRVQADLEEYGSVEQHPQLEGRQMVMVIAPRKR